MIRAGIFALVVVAFGSQASAQQLPQDQPVLQCDIGPVNRVYGEIDWLVYGCVDGETLVFVTSAFPFYFLSYVRDGERRLYGEGNAPQQSTRPAFDDLTALTIGDFEALLTETRAVGQRTPRAE